MQKYAVTGMSCAACVSRVEKAVSKVEGVTSCSVSLLTNSMGVEGSADSSDVIAAVKKAGYSACVFDLREEKSFSGEKKSFNNEETHSLAERLLFSFPFLILLMYVSMGHFMWNLPLPDFFSDNFTASGFLEMFLASVILWLNRRFFVNGAVSLVHANANMDTLVSLGAGISFVYSVFTLSSVVIGKNCDTSMHLYFDGSAMIVTLITVGKLLESVSKGKTADALNALLSLAPRTAFVERNGEVVEIPAEEVAFGDVFIVKPGSSVPVDGVVLEGQSAVNESALTGESIPVDKSSGNEVFCATINENGFLKCRATKVGENTSLAEIIRLVSDASASKAPIAKIADRVAGWFVPVVTVVSIVTFAFWFFAGAEISFALSRSISVLVISCPCALGLATPVAIMVGNGIGAKNGILFKTSSALEMTGRVTVVALDKTGTITKGKPCITDIVCMGKNNVSENEFLQIAASLEYRSEHPLAKAVVNAFCGTLLDVENWQALPGCGVSGFIGGRKFYGGNEKYIKSVLRNNETESDSEKYSDDVKKNTSAVDCDVASKGSVEIDGVYDEIWQKAEILAGQGKTPLFFVCGNEILGMIACADVIKEDSAQAVSLLKKLGIYTVMITGDNERTARAVGKVAGVDKIIAGVLPGEKHSAVQNMKSIGKVCMVGDGINDAPALTGADIGIALGSGSDVAIDAADVVIVKNTLMDVVAAIRLSRLTVRNICQNLFWAFFYNIVGIPLAAGCYYGLTGWTLNPMFAAAAMSLSSFCVVSNALRLNLSDIYKDSHSLYRKYKEKKMSILEKTIRVEGMMCAHCEAHVKEALEKIKGIEEALPDHEKNEVILKMTTAIDEKKLESVISKAGYKMVKKTT